MNGLHEAISGLHQAMNGLREAIIWFPTAGFAG
jgi:hypothetical protein